MSYDLYFKARGGDNPPGIETFAAYFRNRKNYQVSSTQAFYENKLTGVYFAFDLGQPESGDLWDYLPISFNLNFFRPHIFGLEAEPEVRAFVTEFNVSIFDPQNNGMGEGEYSTEGFLNGWNTGNEFGYTAILRQQPELKLPTLPTQRIEDCWRWNLRRDDLQAELGEDVFVPRFIFIKRAEKVATVLVWPDGIPSAIPKADIIVMPRKAILPRNLFGKVSQDTVIAEWKDVENILLQFPLRQGSLPCRLLSYASVPPAISAYVRSLKATKEKSEGVSVDQILNAELVDRVRIKTI